MEVKEQQKRKLIDLAIEAGWRYESRETGLIHFPTPYTIPLYHNFCFCLALLRSLIGDNVQEAKERLLHLLSFQDEKGCFPIFLHEYPKTNPYSKASLPLKLIEKHFGHVLGEDIREKLKRVAPLPPAPKEILTSKDAALSAYFLKDLSPLTPYWDEDLEVYIGPLNDERQNEGTIDLTLFDLYMANATQKFSERIVKPHPVHLEGSLVFPSSPITFSSKEHALPKLSTKGYHLFRKLWKEEGDVHSLVCQEKKMKLDGDVLIYPEDIPDEKHRSELEFYVNIHPSNKVLVEGENITVFKLGQKVDIGAKWKLSFEVLEGSGDFLGHISKGNRPAQLDGDMTRAHDWKISVRTLRRTANLKLKMSLLPA